MLGASSRHVAGSSASTSGRGAATPTASSPRGRRSARLSVHATLVGPDPRLVAPREAGINPLSARQLILPPDDLLIGMPPQRKVFQAEEIAMRRCIRLHEQYPNGVQMPRLRWDSTQLEQAYARCGTVTSEYAKTFYLGTQLMTPVQARAVWAIYVWCRRTDELVDGPNASRITPKALDRWEERLEALFEGRPYDVLDAALTDTIAQFAVDIQPFRDMIEGMRMDLVKTRYATYDELYDYCYRVAGAVALMVMPVMGINPAYKGPMERVYRAALGLGTANQLTNILRDVGEDAKERNRIYIPQEDLERFGITEREVLASFHAPTEGRSSEKWREMMKFQITRARQCFTDAEAGVDLLDQNARWPVWSALMLYRHILSAVEENDYDNFTRRAYVPKWRKLASLPLALGKSLLPVDVKTH